MQKWYGSYKQVPYRPYDIIKYTGPAGYSSEVVYPGIKSVDRSTYADDEDSINYPIKLNENSCESWIRLRFRDWWEGYTAFKDVRLFVSAADPNISLRFGMTTEYERPTVRLSTVAIIPQSACSYYTQWLTVDGLSGITYGTSGEKLSDYIVIQATSYGTDYSYNGTPLYIQAFFTPLGTNISTDMIIEPAGYNISTDMMIIE